MASLVCTKGQYAGANITINGSLSIGRDPKRCQLVISNANGISSMHCEIRAGANGITLTDMGSTNGTFVGGRKLSANETVTLNNGDSFYLADGGNEFKILAEQPVYQQPQPQSAPAPQYSPPPQQPTYQQPQPQPQYVQQTPAPAKKNKKLIPIVGGAIGLVVVIIIIAVVSNLGGDSGGSSYSPSNRSYDDDRGGGGGGGGGNTTDSSIKRITFNLYNDSDGIITEVYVNNQLVYNNEISDGSHSTITFSYDSQIYDMSDTTMKIKVRGPWTGGIFTSEFSVDLTSYKTFTLKEPSTTVYELYPE